MFSDKVIDAFIPRLKSWAFCYLIVIIDYFKLNQKYKSYHLSQIRVCIVGVLYNIGYTRWTTSKKKSTYVKKEYIVA